VGRSGEEEIVCRAWELGVSWEEKIELGVGRRAELLEWINFFGPGVWISAGLVIQPTVNRHYCRFVLTTGSDVVLQCRF